MEDLSEQTPQYFLKICNKFKLGCLQTQQPNPKTIGLSELCLNDLSKAISIIKDLDINTLQILQTKIKQLHELYVSLNECLENGGRVFICGCGATGRLALVLETLWRQYAQTICPEYSDRVIAFMAGGDAALIVSIEDFEDHPEFAAQHLVELGFTQNDILVGSTQGGQTPWVIGAIWKSTQLTNRKPYILYGNSDETLKGIERSREFIQSDKIIKINCNVGEMALAGSTRMQSTTILMHAIGLALLGCDIMRKITNPGIKWEQYAENNINALLEYLNKIDFNCLKNIIEKQSQIYQNNQNLSYFTKPYYAISVLTDTTERSPTFSLTTFPNRYKKSENVCWCTLAIDREVGQNLQWEERVEGDWRSMLGNRSLRGLDSEYWTRWEGKVSRRAILGFGMHEVRENLFEISHPLKFVLKKKQAIIYDVSFPVFPSQCRLSHHTLLKMVLNSISTLVMGRMGRYESNIMTYVKPTNYKLIDRAARYVMMLNPSAKYQQAIYAIYQLRHKIKECQPIVIKVIEYLRKQKEIKDHSQIKQSDFS